MAPLRYFVFTASEDGFGQAAWEGLASLRAEDLDAAQSELRLLLSALEARAPGPRARWKKAGPGTGSSTGRTKTTGSSSTSA
jgi:hypothetical protein